MWRVKKSGNNIILADKLSVSCKNLSWGWVHWVDQESRLGRRSEPFKQFRGIWKWNSAQKGIGARQSKQTV